MAGSPYAGVIPNVNAPDVKVPTNQELNFNPNGFGAVGTGLLDPVGAIFAYSANKAAREATRRVYPNAAGSPQADAFRHGAGSRILKGTIGDTRAKNWGDAHEVDGIDPPPIAQSLGLVHKNSEGQRAMDLYNNQVGRALPGGRAPDIQDAIKAGRFRLRPFGE
jgi:hypothetical protein